ncbi:substrate-binding domain-containing protein [Actinocatenispora sera]|uniref:substrate-binding domain-containing protein n=1 Tax=Actinocatenispora sera TaxID=390989 RepID=UPI0033F8C203
MPRGNHAKGGLRSHRRRIGKHLVIAPWIIITAICALVLAGLTTTWVVLVTRGCGGSAVTATVYADPAVSSIIDKQAQTWMQGSPAVDGHCAKISVVPRDSASVAAALAPSWDPRTDGTRPDAWVPESSLWMQLAASRPDAARMLPERRPSLARSPAVIAMPKPMAEVMKKVAPKLTWNQLATQYAGKVWAKYGHPSWGGIRVDMTDATTSTAGLHAVTAMADANDDGDISTAERLSLNQIWQVGAAHPTDTQQVIQKLESADSAGTTAVLKTVSAFPALEQDVISYNQDGPKVPLTAVYPSDGSADADFPYLRLSWSHQTTPGINDNAQRVRSDIARTFLTDLRSATAKKAFRDAGYRDASRRPGPLMTAANGVDRKVPTLPRKVMSPDSVSQTVSMWTSISRDSNVLLIMDVSSGMGQKVAGTNKTKLQLAGDAVAEAITLFGPGARLGLWDYASHVKGDSADYEQIVPVDTLNGTYQGTTRRVAINNALDQLQPVGEPTLYDTVAAAYKMMRKHYQNDASNRIVVVTGSGNDSASKTGLAELTSTLNAGADKNHPLPVVTVGYGSGVDLSSLQTISQASGGRTYAASSPTEVSKVLLTALFSGAPPTSD